MHQDMEVSLSGGEEFAISNFKIKNRRQTVKEIAEHNTVKQPLTEDGFGSQFHAILLAR